MDASIQLGRFSTSRSEAAGYSILRSNSQEVVRLQEVIFKTAGVKQNV